MATAVTFDSTGVAGISTHAKDLRGDRNGKKVRNMLGQLGCAVPPAGFAGLTTSQLAKRDQPKGGKNFAMSRSTSIYYENNSSIYPPPLLSTNRPAKPVHKRYATDSDYEMAFDVRWRPDKDGRMALFLSRKPGNAAIETHPAKLDMIRTFHRDRGSAGHVYMNDNICNDGFVTGKIESNTSDVLKPLGNRAPPFDNPDGPFEINPSNQHPSRRTCNPRINDNSLKRDHSGKAYIRRMRERSHIYPLEGLLVGDNFRHKVETKCSDLHSCAA